MKYKFVSKEQARNDWENGRVGVKHNGNGYSTKLNSLCWLCIDKDTPSGMCNFYCIYHKTVWYGAETLQPNIPSVPTDELWEMIFGEYKEKNGNEEYVKGWKDGFNQGLDFMKQEPAPKPQEEIIGYELNGKVSKEQMRDFLRCSAFDFQLTVGEPHSDKVIKKASDLGILSTCFYPIYKQKDVEVEVKLSDGVALIKGDKVVLVYKDSEWSISITDIQRILDAHKTL